MARSIRRFVDSDHRRLTDLEAAWAAGVIEGEGCIRLQVIDIKDYRSGRFYKDRVTMSVTVSMKDSAVINRFASLIGGHYHVRPDGLATVTMSSRRALWFLSQIERFLVGDKKPQAQLAIEFQKQRIPGRRTKAQHAWELDSARRISEMKKVGVYATRKGPKATRLEAAIGRQNQPTISSTTATDRGPA